MMSALLYLLAGCVVSAQPPAKVDLSGYRAVGEAITRDLPPPRTTRGGQTGYLGVSLERDTQGKLVVEALEPDSPAEKAGLHKGDRVMKIDGQSVSTVDAFRDWLQTRGPGDVVTLGLQREEQTLELKAMLAATSRPRSTPTRRAFLGVEWGEAKEGQGVRVEQVVPESPAAVAGFEPGDRVLKVDGADFTRAARMNDILTEKRPGDILAIAVRRGEQELLLRPRLTAEAGGRGGRGGAGGGPGGGGRRGGGFGGGLGTIELWKRPVFKVAVVLIEFPDHKHNAGVPLKEWDEAFFSKGTYHDKKNATGDTVQGSLNDYFLEQSAGAFHLEGKTFNWIEVSKKSAEYAPGSGTSNRTAVLSEAVEKLQTRDGKEALKEYDGLLFLYAGEAIRTNRGGVYYPHAGTLGVGTRRLPYLFTAEGGSHLTPLGGFVKEFSQMLGLPDLAARPENQGSVGLGVWCALSNPFATARPQHLSAWAKEKLGWIKPAVIDPNVKQKLLLAAIEGSGRECVKVLARADGSEYFLLENRRKQGFDKDLPAEGLLIWRVVNDRPTLLESHGIDGPKAPTVHLDAVPYPSAANHALTPETTPSSRSPLGGGLTVSLTNIRRLPDGRIAFGVGYEYR